MNIDDKTYDILAWVGRKLLPALSVLYGTLGKLFHLPLSEEIPLAITAVDLFWNTILGISSTDFFNKHEIVEAVVDKNVGQG